MIRFKNPAVEREDKTQRRLKVFFVLLCAGYSVLAVRALLLMLKDNEALEKIAMSQYRFAIQQETDRSRILDAKGNELAISVPAWSLYADPREVEDPSSAALALSKILPVPFKALREKFEAKKKFVWLTRRINAPTMEKIEALRLKGIFSLKENMRFYPHGELAGSVLGAVGIDSQALAGIEMTYDPYLMITQRSSVYFRDARGQLYQPLEPLERVQGKGDVYLTLDKNLQFFAEQSLKKAVEEHHAGAGVVVLMDPVTGAILALANNPAFNPNQFNKTEWGAWRNRAVTDIYEPGSTFKLVVVAKALQDKRISLNEKFNCERGRLALPHGEAIHDHKPYGLLNVREIIKVSSNIGTYKIEQRVGKEKLFEMMKAFGFGSKTGIDFLGESAGIVRPVRHWRPIEEVTMSFGYGVSVTPLQLLSAYASVAGGGVRMRPYLVEKVLGEDGNILYQAVPQELGRPVDPETAKTLTRILKGVVESGGTGVQAALDSYSVAGKSGTARKIDPILGGYLEGHYFSSFVGFAPADNPRLAALVLIDDPKGSFYGGMVAAPVFREVLQHALHYLGVPPEGKSVPAWVAAPDPTPTCGDCDQAFTREGDYFRVPDFRGASLRQVLKSTSRFPLEIQLAGRGKATGQIPKPGTLVSAGGRIFVEFEPLY